LRELARNNNRLELGKTEELMQLKADVLAAIDQWQPAADLPSRLATKLAEMAAEGIRVAQAQRILDSLSFQSMRVRHAKIPVAFARTFEWAFESVMPGSSEPNQLLDWLATKNGIFWVAGKPGSGKSTLMKHLSDHPRTRTALYSWAGESDLVIAAYFFWSAGAELQKTQEGLLRSLTFEVLRAVPDMIPRVFPHRWQDQALHDQRPKDQILAWTQYELLEAVSTLAQENIESAKFCFFIDGLDENDGDYEETINLMKSMAENSHFKLCLSSRPWNAFEEAFGQDLSRKLYLQDLTRGDIQLYVERKLHQNHRFAHLCQEDQRYLELELEIVEKAKGVFLWVFLVVRSLLQGLTNADKISDMQRRLKRFPAELEPFFKHMLDSVENIYQEEMASFFLVALQSAEPLSVTTYTYLEERDPNFAITVEVMPLDEACLPAMYGEMRKRLNARCKGLLEFVDDPFADDLCRYKIDFLHRTVRDFLQAKDMQNILIGQVHAGFEPITFICKALLAQLKSVPQNAYRFRDADHLGHLLDDIRYYAHQFEQRHSIAAIAELDELDRVLSIYQQAADRFSKETTFFSRSNSCFVYDFLILAIEGNLALYVAHKLSSQPHLVHQQINGHSLLHHALHPPSVSFATRSSSMGRPNPKIIEFLLDHGANPNERLNVWTTWGSFLHTIYQRQALCDASEKKIWFEVVYSMLMHCADPDWRSDMYMARSILCVVFTEDQVSVLDDIIQERGGIGTRIRNWLGWRRG
jgi:hypothetical protein